MKINIIGAGPAGSYTAYLLAKNGHEVKVYEKNPEIGKPVQCTGILSDYFTKTMQPKSEFVLNTITKTRIYSPNNKFIETKIKTNYVICRKKFDNYLADKAKKTGAKYHLNHSFQSYKKESNKLISTLNHKGKQITSESNILIGADGPLSKVTECSELNKNRKFVIGTQIEAKLKNNNVVEFYPHIGCYSWIVPINKNTVRIGVVSYKDSKKLFDKFVKQKLGKNYKTIENQSGIIPIFNPKNKVQKNNVYLIGDAAGFVKATSGGGINQSLKAAEILTGCINNNKNYNLEIKRNLFPNLYFHLLAHNIIQKFNDKDWNILIKTFNEPKLKKILQTESRDNIIKMLIKITIAKPSLLKYLHKLF